MIYKFVLPKLTVSFSSQQFSLCIPAEQSDQMAAGIPDIEISTATAHLKLNKPPRRGRILQSNEGFTDAFTAVHL